MYTDTDLLPLSALQHLMFCERQCALIHIEGQWADNVLTVEGSQMHERVDEGTAESRPGVRVERSVSLRSFRLGLVGVADVVEFRAPAGGDGSPTVPFPIEYKRGRPKQDFSDRVQLCAQALCLEEMLETTVPSGALFYGRTRRRLEVEFSDDLREKTETAARKLHELIRKGITPVAKKEPKCDRCSLYDLCLPGGVEVGRSAQRFLDQIA